MTTPPDRRPRAAHETPALEDDALQRVAGTEADSSEPAPASSQAPRRNIAITDASPSDHRNLQLTERHPESTGNLAETAHNGLSAQENQPLFRSEVIEARRSQWLGTVLLAPRVSHRLFAGLSIIIVLAMIALLTLGEFTRKARVTGWLVPEQGLVQVFAPQAGVVGEVFRGEGEQVKAGEPLVAISTERQTSTTARGTEAEITRLLDTRRSSMTVEIEQQERLLAQQRKGLERRMQAMRAEIDQFDRELAVQQSRAKLATASADRMRDLAAQGFASKMQIQQLEDAELDQRARLRTLERQRGERQRELVAVQAEADDLPFKAQSQIATLKRSIAELEQDLASSEARRRLLISAPTSGTLTALQVHAGSNATTATPMLSILPAGSKLEAQLFTPSRSIGFVRAGQQVLLRYQAFPYQKFGHHTGVIKAISMTAISPAELPPQLSRLTALTTTGEPLYRISVELDRQDVVAYGKPVPLHPGMQLESDILLERRKLYEWILEPLYTLTGKL